MESINPEKIELPIIARRTLVANGDSIMVSIPAEWLKQKDLKKGDTVILVANGNLTIHQDNPEVISTLSQKIGGE